MIKFQKFLMHGLTQKTDFIVVAWYPRVDGLTKMGNLKDGLGALWLQGGRSLQVEGRG